MGLRNQVLFPRVRVAAEIHHGRDQDRVPFEWVPRNRLPGNWWIFSARTGSV